MRRLIELLLVSYLLTASPEAVQAAQLSARLDRMDEDSQQSLAFQLAKGESRLEATPDTYEKLKEKLGITYFTNFYGPGIHPDKVLFNPNQLGNAQKDGNYFQNQVSIRYKFSKTLAFDFQTRFDIILNNGVQNPEYSPFRWETPRAGVSGKLINGDEWTLTGAINTDLPYFLPVPFSGYSSEKRKVLLSLGMFAALKYEPRNSPWTVFTVLSPRYFIYDDPNAVDSQTVRSGLSANNKPDIIIGLQPTINYKISKTTRITLGTSIDYRKYVISDWNLFQASLETNGDSKAWRLGAIPVNLGMTFDVSPSVTLFPFFMIYPIAVQRIDAVTGNQATFLETASIGMWLYGTLF